MPLLWPGALTLTVTPTLTPDQVVHFELTLTLTLTPTPGQVVHFELWRADEPRGVLHLVDLAGSEVRANPNPYPLPPNPTP